MRYLILDLYWEHGHYPSLPYVPRPYSEYSFRIRSTSFRILEVQGGFLGGEDAVVGCGVEGSGLPTDPLEPVARSSWQLLEYASWAHSDNNDLVWTRKSRSKTHLGLFRSPVFDFRLLFFGGFFNTCSTLSLLENHSSNALEGPPYGRPFNTLQIWKDGFLES